MINDYEFRIIPKEDADGNNYWYAFFPAVEGCVGGGKTPQEALNEAQESLNVMLEYLKEENIELPKAYQENEYSGKISLRISKSTHKKVALMAAEEDVSINSFLNSAIECYVGKKEYDKTLERKIEEVKDYCDREIVEDCKNKIVKNLNQRFALSPKGREVYA